jgi:hypothetical protein
VRENWESDEDVIATPTGKEVQAAPTQAVDGAAGQPAPDDPHEKAGHAASKVVPPESDVDAVVDKLDNLSV